MRSSLPGSRPDKDCCQAAAGSGSFSPCLTRLASKLRSNGWVQVKNGPATRLPYLARVLAPQVEPLVHDAPDRQFRNLHVCKHAHPNIDLEV
jgi:hypothetical protein